jgi:hypothetical protein
MTTGQFSVLRIQGLVSTLKLMFAAIVCPMWLCGCAPVLEYYYQPSSDKGTLFADMCHSGPKSNVMFPLGGATLQLHSRFDGLTFREYAIDVQLGLRKQDSGQVAWHEISVRQLDGTVIPFASDTYAYNLPFTSADIPHHQTIVGDSVDGKTYAWYEYLIKLQSPLPDEFMFTMPSMSIDGVSYPSSVVRFVKKSGLWIIPLNC